MTTLWMGLRWRVVPRNLVAVDISFEERIGSLPRQRDAAHLCHLEDIALRLVEAGAAVCQPRWHWLAISIPSGRGFGGGQRLELRWLQPGGPPAASPGLRGDLLLLTLTLQVRLVLRPALVQPALKLGEVCGGSKSQVKSCPSQSKHPTRRKSMQSQRESTRVNVSKAAPALVLPALKVS